MGTTLYLDCTCGISGDMTVAALLDAGASEERLRATLGSLPVDGYTIRIGRTSKAGLDCCDFDVVLDAVHENHDHDMAYLHGHEHGHEYECTDHGHGHEHGCGHEEHGHEHDDHDGAHEHDHHDHEHHCEHDHAHDGSHGDHGHHYHKHRGSTDIDRIIDAGALTPRARALAHRMVDVLAHAEAKAHGVPLEEVHFHEVGAVDSIVDIVSVAVLVDDLDVDRVIVPRLVDGHGTIRCQHGIIPVPVPATLNIVEQHGLPLSIGSVEGELVTPTGAAIVAALDAERDLPARFRVRRVGLGAGKRAYECPSILRALIIEELPAAPNDAVHGASKAGEGIVPTPAKASVAADAVLDVAAAGSPAPTVDAAYPGEIVRLECDIDDATGEVLAYAADRLREAGAREVHWVPIFAKKGRPAWQLQIIAAPADVARLEAIVFAETTTIGIRRWVCQRSVLPRTEHRVQTPWGEVRVKAVTLPDGSLRTAPEYEDAAALARASGVPLQQVMDAARAAASHLVPPAALV